MESELRQAVVEGDFEISYQPKVDIASWTISGAEALLRWKHSARGWISPADFIPVAEETGLILPLGRWVLQKVCRQIGEWQHSRLNNIDVSVNISSRQMYSDDLVSVVQDAVTDAGIRPELLKLEITESLLMRDTDATIEALKALKDFGVGVSVDDFGTGYSSLSYLKRFPIDELKIDRSFVQDLHRDADDAAICAAVLAMARQLDLKVVAEGVEIEEQLEFLRRHNCEQVQGYLFSKPISAKEFAALFHAQCAPREKAAV
jgi:EAL domain-containing protein (putative c-di-GMP-specific phosphodiesterase class I)